MNLILKWHLRSLECACSYLCCIAKVPSQSSLFVEVIVIILLQVCHFQNFVKRNIELIKLNLWKELYSKCASKTKVMTFNVILEFHMILPRMKISLNMNISVFRFYENIGKISVDILTKISTKYKLLKIRKKI